MDKNTLIKNLQEIPGNPEVEVKYSNFNCGGHGPGEYCYCANEEKQVGIDYLVQENHSTKGKKLGEPKIVLYVD